MRRCVKRLRTYLGRVVRDIERKTADNSAQQAVFTGELGLARRLLTQRKEDMNKLRLFCLEKGRRLWLCLYQWGNANGLSGWPAVSMAA